MIDFFARFVQNNIQLKNNCNLKFRPISKIMTQNTRKHTAHILSHRFHIIGSSSLNKSLIYHCSKLYSMYINMKKSF